MYKKLATKSPRKKPATKAPRATKPVKWVNIWVDHHVAHIVTFDPASETCDTIKIESQVADKHKTTGGRGGKTGILLSVTSEKNEDNWRETHLAKYYKSIISEITDAKRIIIMGPGTAKSDLKKAMESKKTLANKLEDVVTAAKMTEKQLLTKTKKVFATAD